MGSLCTLLGQCLAAARFRTLGVGVLVLFSLGLRVCGFSVLGFQVLHFVV